MSCLSCFCSVKLSGSLLPPVPLFDQTLRHIAYRAMSSMNHYGGIYWNEPLWRYLLKWTIMEVSIENCAFESQWKSESSRHLMGWKSIIWCIFIILFTLKYLSKSESVHENPLYATFSKYDYHSSSETIMISKILLHTLLSGPSLAVRPFEEQPHYILMKSHHMLESHHVMESHY